MSTRKEPGTRCSLYIDMPLGQAVMEGDWITTHAGARYLVLNATMGATKRHSQQTRWSMSCLRLERDLQVPEGVHAVELRWYKR